MFLATVIINTNTAKVFGATQNTYVPCYLKKRSRDLVLTSLNRLEASKNLDKTNIVQAESGEFSAVSHTDNATHTLCHLEMMKICPTALLFMEKVILPV